MKPTVGSIVHFYTLIPEGQSNGSGTGPYAAIVTQVFGDGDGAYANLKVFLPFGETLDVGSVRHADFDRETVRYWVWPPRE